MQSLVEFGGFCCADRSVLNVSPGTTRALAVLIDGLVSGEAGRPKRALEGWPGPKGTTRWDPQRGGTAAPSSTPPVRRGGSPLSLLPRPPCSTSAAPCPPLHSESSLSWPTKGIHAVEQPNPGHQDVQSAPSRRGVHSTFRVDGVKSLCEVSARCCRQPPS